MSLATSPPRGGVLAIVPARAGSKGLPGKNIRPLAGHPLIAWSVAAGRAARSVDRLIVSTDSPEIAKVAEGYGAEIPFLRPAVLADDMATDLDVFAHALRWLAEEQGYRPELVVQLRPTTPFRDPRWIDEAVRRMLGDPTISCVRSVTPAPHTPYKMWKLDRDAMLTPLMALPGIVEPFNLPRQKLPPVYWHTGQLDVIRADTILANSVTGPRIASLEVDAATAVDIDHLEDFEFAQLVFDRRMPACLREVIAR